MWGKNNDIRQLASGRHVILITTVVGGFYVHSEDRTCPVAGP